jgi:hypothetical protein
MIRVDQTTICKWRLLLYVSRLVAERLRSLGFNVIFNLKVIIATQLEKTSTLQALNFKNSRKKDSVTKSRLNA